MPDPKRLLPTLRRARQAFRDTPGRRGRRVEIQGADDVLVAGDLHGHVENFRRLLERADLAAHPNRHLVLQELVHGPFRYPSGGDKSHQLLDLLAALKCQYPLRVHMLLGNHELAQWTNQWISKDNLDLNVVFRQGVRTAYGPDADDILQAYDDLFAAMPLALRTENRVFLSHSLPNAKQSFNPTVLEQDEATEADLRPGGTVYGLVWGRNTSAENARSFLERVDADLLITGHIPCDDGYEAPNPHQLILDSHGVPSAYCVFPARGPITHADLLRCVEFL